MLVLGRKEGDVVTIKTPEGRVITVTAVALRNHSIRLGFEADPDVKIIRNEAIQPGPGGERGQE